MKIIYIIFLYFISLRRYLKTKILRVGQSLGIHHICIYVNKTVMYNLLLATLTVKVHFMTFRVERILTEITYYFKKIIKNSLQPLYSSQNYIWGKYENMKIW